MTKALDHAQIRAALARVLSSEGFRGSPRLSRFLQYIVESALAGAADQVKEYSIGIDVFTKSPSFDPRVDSTVRGEATKLRFKLRLYYETEGRTDPIIISVAKGGYSPSFEARSVVGRRNKYWIPAAIAGALVLGMVVTWTKTDSSFDRGRKLTQLTTDVGLTVSPAMSPAGDVIAYASDRAGRGDLDVWVQSLSGRENVRLTAGEADEYDPVFSPDGRQIAFRSDQNGGGIYVIPVAGGEPRLIAASGNLPRYSPDSSLIAYSIGTWRFIAATPRSGQMFVIPAKGGTPRRLAPEFASAHYPIWAPDGRHILFLGRKEAPLDGLDWWVTPVHGGAVVNTGALPMFRGLKLGPPAWPRMAWIPWLWSGDSILFSAQSAHSTNLWRAKISLKTWKITGEPERVTFGTATEVSASASPSGALAFATVRSNLEVWSLPIDADRRRVTGAPRRLTQNDATDSWPSISRDGRKLVFFSLRTGDGEIWSKDLDTGKETPLTADREWKDYPEVSPAGSSFLYTLSGPTRIVRVRMDGGAAETLCEHCQTPSFLSDGSFLHTNTHPPVHILLRSNGRPSLYLKHPEWELHQAQLSPDEAWIAFYALLGPEKTRIYIAPFRKSRPPAVTEWIAITDDVAHHTTPLWSPNGKVIYYGSNRDGFQCIWAHALDPVRKQPKGPPEAVGHFHNAALRMGNIGVSRRGMSVARDQIVFPLQEVVGNLWILR